MQQMRIKRKPVGRCRRDDDRYAVLPLDPRDPDIVRAKQLLRNGSRPEGRTR